MSQVLKQEQGVYGRSSLTSMLDPLEHSLGSHTVKETCIPRIEVRFWHSSLSWCAVLIPLSGASCVT